MAGRRNKGFSLLELAVVAAVISALLAVFLERLTFYQEAAEKAQFESTLRIYKTALQIHMAELILDRREGDARQLEAENPTLWLSEKPTNYAGNFPSRPQPGYWYFDATSRELVYVVNSGRQLLVDDAQGRKQLRFRVKIIYQMIDVAGGRVRGIGGIGLLPTVNYQWS